MTEFVHTLDEALAALADPASAYEYRGIQHAFGCTFHLIASKGRCANHGYSTEALIRWVDQELF
jgi:hypothetical protein